MKAVDTTKQIAKEAATKLALSLTVVSVVGLSTSPVMAQGLQAGQMEQLSQMSGLGADQESLLPPEVVPMDSQAAQQLSQSQAQARQMGGYDAVQAGATPAMNARNNRQDAFNALMGREDLSQQMNPAQFQPMNGAQMDQYAPGQLLPQAQNQAGQQFNQQLAQQQQQMGVTAWQQPGQNGNSFPAQNQTLAGKVKKAPVKGLARTGLAHTLTGLAAFGAGAYTMSLMRSPAMLYSGGMMGFGLGNYALRNGFRF
ncbi:MAG: hypothetical protein DKT66_25485 [Candidatus Melainabacteria bacterium]|nr:MAG: hypothetical protein DKT66_25485 [Candidatus Melainabacteria bacterium]